MRLQSVCIQVVYKTSETSAPQHTYGCHPVPPTRLTQYDCTHAWIERRRAPRVVVVVDLAAELLAARVRTDRRAQRREVAR